MAWLRKMPIYSVLMLALAGLILAAALGYYAYATFSATHLRGNLDSGGHGSAYEWHGERLLLQEANGRTSSTCVIDGQAGAKRSVYVPRDSAKGMFNPHDFAEIPPQPGTTATITCSNTVYVSAGDSAVQRARTVNSLFFKAGVPALATIPVLASLGIPVLRRRTREESASPQGDISGF